MSSPLSRGRKVLFSVVGLVLAYGLLELLSLVTFRVHYGRWFSFADQARARQSAGRADESARAEGELTRILGTRIVHPYLGYVYSPGEPVGDLTRKDLCHKPHCEVNGYGFLGQEPLNRPTPQALNVVILGGSFGNQFYVVAQDRLRQRLLQTGRYRGRKVRIFCLALGGYKQPQQVMALNYFLALGGQVDLVINIDGYNEVARTDFIHSKGLFPVYPEQWRSNFPWLASKKTTRLIGSIAVLRQTTAELARGAGSLRFSVTGSLGWSLLNDAMVRRINKQNVQLDRIMGQATGRSFMRDGPAVELRNVATYYAGVWRSSSLQLDALAKRLGFTYLHFLQPNQYFKGSKPLTARERKHAVTLPGAEVEVTEWYRMLRKVGAQLRKQGVTFLDLSMLFKDVKETLYIDNCCHVNRLGYVKVADAIVEQVATAERK